MTTPAESPDAPIPDNKVSERVSSKQSSRRAWTAFFGKIPKRSIVLLVGLLICTTLALMAYWSLPPAAFSAKATSEKLQAQLGQERPLVTGQAFTGTAYHLMHTLLNKPGGYLSNDISPPGAFLDNMPNWEFGVLVQVRDATRALRNDLSRSQSQSVEDKDLIKAEPQFNFDSESWILPSTEGEYQQGLDALGRYFVRLNEESSDGAQFYARADNLNAWLKQVEKRLGSLSQRLSSSVAQVRTNTDLGGDPAAEQAKAKSHNLLVKTPWLEIDDVFYEARGSAYALLHLLKAVEQDFASVLEKKNALVSLQQIIRELEASQRTLWSPIILNGSGFGLTANHSLVMASYLSRANAAVIDLRNLLADG